MKRRIGLWDLLIIVGVICLIALIAIPMVIDNIQEDKCEETEKAASNILDALSAYFTDYNQYPHGDFSVMKASLETSYLENISTTDAWGANWIYTTSDGPVKPDQNYSLISYARDKKEGPKEIKSKIDPEEPERHDYDIIVENGAFKSNCR